MRAFSPGLGSADIWHLGWIIGFSEYWPHGRPPDKPIRIQSYSVHVDVVGTSGDDTQTSGTIYTSLYSSLPTRARLLWHNRRRNAWLALAMAVAGAVLDAELLGTTGWDIIAACVGAFDAAVCVVHVALCFF